MGHTGQKYATAGTLPSLGNLLVPLQLGCGMSLGCEFMPPVLLTTQSDCWPDATIIDSKSAFNASLGLYLLVHFICLHLDKMLMTVKESIPELPQFVHRMHIHPSYSSFAETKQLSQPREYSTSNVNYVDDKELGN